MAHYQMAESPHCDDSYVASTVITVGNLTGTLLICYIQHVYDYHFCIACIRYYLSHGLAVPCGLVIRLQTQKLYYIFISSL